MIRATGRARGDGDGCGELVRRVAQRAELDLVHDAHRSKLHIRAHSVALPQWGTSRSVSESSARGSGRGSQCQASASTGSASGDAPCAAGTSSAAEKTAAEYGVPFATVDVAQLCARDDVDVVFVATPPHLHRDVVLAALDAGKHVVCEKPFGLGPAEALEMLAARRAATAPPLPRLRVPHRSGAAGVGSTHPTRRPGRGPSGRDHRHGRGRELPGDEPRGMVATSRARRRLARRHGFALPRRAPGLVRRGQLRVSPPRNASYAPHRRARRGPRSPPTTGSWPGSSPTRASSASSTPQARSVSSVGPRVEIYGTTGAAVLEHDHMLTVLDDSGHADRRDFSPQASNPRTHPSRNAMGVWANEIVEAVGTGTQIAPNFLDGLRAQEIMDAARRSSDQRGVEVTVERHPLDAAIRHTVLGISDEQRVVDLVGQLGRGPAPVDVEDRAAAERRRARSRGTRPRARPPRGCCPTESRGLGDRVDHLLAGSPCLNSSIIGVSIWPGDTLFMRTPCSRNNVCDRRSV